MLKKQELAYRQGQLNYFFQRQVKELLSEGLPALFRKCGIILELPFALLVVLLVRLIRPFILIRFIPLTSSRIGHFTTETEMYLCKRDLLEVRKGWRNWDIFYCVPPICNRQLKKMWGRDLAIIDFAYWFDKVNRKIPGGDMHTGFMPSYRDIRNLFETAPIHLSFTVAEKYLGQEALRNIGIPEGAPFVCFHARDSAYLSSVLPANDWNSYDFRDSDIRNYLPAAMLLAERGYFMVRMGAIVKESLDNHNSRIIDYAAKYRSEFLDIYLPSKCIFFVSSLTGIAEVAEAFRKPIVWVNCIPIEHIHSWGANDLIITKRLWLRNEKRFLTFSEIFNSGIGEFYRNEDYEKAGIEVLENTPEEITAVAIEMDERIKGIWQPNREDEELQYRFWSVLGSTKLHGEIRARIGAEFLRKNKELLV